MSLLQPLSHSALFGRRLDELRFLLQIVSGHLLTQWQIFNSVHMVCFGWFWWNHSEGCCGAFAAGGAVLSCVLAHQAVPPIKLSRQTSLLKYWASSGTASRLPWCWPQPSQRCPTEMGKSQKSGAVRCMTAVPPCSWHFK